MWLPVRWFQFFTPHDPRLARLYARMGLTVLVAAAFGILPAFTLGLRPALHSFCLMQALLGLPCPGCGMTRAFVLLREGALGQAFAANPASFALALVLVLPFALAPLSRISTWSGRRTDKVLRFGDSLVIASLGAAWVHALAVTLLPRLGG